MSNLPKDIEPRQIRQFLAACTGEKYDGIKNVIHSIKDEELGSTRCLVSHDDEESMLCTFKSLEEYQYMG